jgi:hypothetical protein
MRYGHEKCVNGQVFRKSEIVADFSGDHAIDFGRENIIDYWLWPLSSKKLVSLAAIFCKSESASAVFRSCEQVWGDAHGRAHPAGLASAYRRRDYQDGEGVPPVGDGREPRCGRKGRSASAPLLA